MSCHGHVWRVLAHGAERIHWRCIVHIRHGDRHNRWHPVHRVPDWPATYRIVTTGGGVTSTINGTCTYDNNAVAGTCTNQYRDTTGQAFTSVSTTRHATRGDVVDEVSVIPPLQRSLGTTTTLTAVPSTRRAPPRSPTTRRNALYPSSRRPFRQAECHVHHHLYRMDSAGRPTVASSSRQQLRPTPMTMPTCNANDYDGGCVVFAGVRHQRESDRRHLQQRGHVDTHDAVDAASLQIVARLDMAVAAFVVTSSIAGLPVVLGDGRRVAAQWRHDSTSTRAAAFVTAAALLWMAVTWSAAKSGIFATGICFPAVRTLDPRDSNMSAAIASSTLGRRLAQSIPLWRRSPFRDFDYRSSSRCMRCSTRGVMPEQMSYSGRNFDIVTGATAIIVSALVWSGRGGRRLVAAWNGLGLLLLTNVVIVAILRTPRFRYFGDDALNTWVFDPPFVWLRR